MLLNLNEELLTEVDKLMSWFVRVDNYGVPMEKYFPYFSSFGWIEAH